MIVKGWNNGNPNDKSGVGYGIILTKTDRDEYFKQSWASITLDLDGLDSFQVKLSKSFWKNCIELRSSKVGKWLLNKGLAPWNEEPPSNTFIRNTKR